MEAFESWLAGAETLRRQTGRPLVTLSYAQSLDGSLTTRRGQPTVLSGLEAQRLTHRLRALHQAILVGIGTVLTDDPRLTVRLAEGEHPQPVVLDSHLRTPPQAQLISSHPKPAWVAAVAGFAPETRRLLEESGGKVLILPADQTGRVDLPSLLGCLGEMDISSLMVEGGAQVISSFFAQSLVDQVVLTIAPVFLGGLKATAEGVFENSDISELGSFPQLADPEYVKLGKDLVIWGKLAR